MRLWSVLATVLAAVIIGAGGLVAVESAPVVPSTLEPEVQFAWGTPRSGVSLSWSWPEKARPKILGVTIPGVKVKRFKADSGFGAGLSLSLALTPRADIEFDRIVSVPQKVLRPSMLARRASYPYQMVMPLTTIATRGWGWAAWDLRVS